MFRFTIRDLFWLTVVVALVVTAGLLQLDRRRIAKVNGELRKELSDVQAAVASKTITKEQAVKIVRQEMAKNSKQVLRHQVLDVVDEFQVYVDFGTNGSGPPYQETNRTYAVSKKNGRALLIRAGY